MELDQVKTIRKRYIMWGFFGVIAIANASLTAAFGATFGNSIMPTSVPWVSSAIGAFIHLLFYDIAAFSWFVIKGDAESNEQRAIAGFLAMASIVASVLVSVTQLVYTTSLVDLSPLQSAIGFLSLVVMLILTAGHFFGIFAYNIQDPAFKKADIEAALSAALASEEAKQMQSLLNQSLQKSAEVMEANAEAIALATGDELAIRLARQMGYKGSLTLASGRVVHPQNTLLGGEEIIVTQPVETDATAGVFAETKPAYTNGVDVVNTSPLSASGS